jgi:NAD(P)H-hydrate epimerase
MKLTAEFVRGLIPKRSPYSHKGDYGRVLIIGGSVGYSGAPCLSALAAVRSGAGLVWLGVPQSIYTIAAVKMWEAMPFPLEDSEGHISKSALPEILRRLEGMSSCLIGIGMGRYRDAEAIVEAVLSKAQCPVVLDADGINAVSGNIDILKRAACPVILTPHEGEFRRFGRDIINREEAAVSFAKESGCTTVLKGHDTVTAFPDGSFYVNGTGNPGMAKGGSGDVLAGMLAGLLGQLPLRAACAAAVWLHGKAGDLAAEKYGEYSMTPSDLIDNIPEAFG